MKPGKSADSIRTVRLERTPCYATCPVYTVEIRFDGRLAYEGRWWVPIIGDVTVVLPPGSFARLAALIERHDFWSLNDHYPSEPAPTDCPSRIITVTTDSRHKTVDDYGPSGPEGLTRIEKAIVSRVRRYVWVRAELLSPQ